MRHDLPALEALYLDHNTLATADGEALHEAIEKSSAAQPRAPKLRELDVRWQAAPGGLTGQVAEGLRLAALVSRNGALLVNA